MTVFKSNADEIKYYAINLLNDGLDHTRSGIIDYVIRESGRNDFTDGNFSGSLNDLVKKKQISIIRRGVYKITAIPSVSDAKVQETIKNTIRLDDQCIMILNNTIKDLRDSANKVDVLSITDEDQQTIQKIKLSIDNLMQSIKLFEK